MKLVYPLSIYKTLDKDKNGHISIKEMKKSKKFLESVMENANSTQKINVKKIFKNLDLNHNGKIEPKEIDKSLEDQININIILFYHLSKSRLHTNQLHFLRNNLNWARNQPARWGFYSRNSNGHETK